MKHFAPEADGFSVSKIPECPDTAKWYCVVVRPSWSARVSAELYALGHRIFTPKVRRWQGTRRVSAVERPLSGLGSYLFVEVDYPRQSFAQVRGVRGIIEIMGVHGAPTAFSRSDVTAFLLRQMKGEWDEIEGPDVVDHKRKPPIGAKVMVVEGPHDGKEAVVTSTKGKKIFAKVEGQAVPSTFFASSLRAA